MSRKEYQKPEMVETRLYLEHPYKRGVFLPIRRCPLRLPDCDYTSVECLCFVTFNVHPQCGVRFTGESAELAWQSMWNQFNLVGCSVHAAALMPDHVHWLLAPSGRGESIRDIVQRVKTLIGTALRKEHGIYLKWQSSFYDHVLQQHDRAGEYDGIVSYIYDNPVRAELGEGYPFRFRTE